MQKESRYDPAEDSFFLEGHIKNLGGRCALDMGTGSGILAKALAKNFDLVVATDINMDALGKAHEEVDNCICCNAADALRPVFDLVVCNLPYLPSDTLVDRAVDGLECGVKIPEMMIRSASQTVAKNGKMVFLTSSLADYGALVQLGRSLGFDSAMPAKKKLFYEELVIVEFTRGKP